MLPTTAVSLPPSSTQQPLKPFLKWAGGKQRLITQYQDYFPDFQDINRYYEPFIGGGAVFFHYQPETAVLADRNQTLMDVYRAVQQNVDAVIAALKPHHNDADYFYEVRAWDEAKLTLAERAARIIFLNKTCFNGLFRENSKGKFNVPFGRYKKPKICNEVRLRQAAAALQSVTLMAADFENVVETAVAGDFVYFDPPYAPLTATSSFTQYDKDGFALADQIRLSETVDILTKRNCKVMLSNSSAPIIYDLYAKDYRLVEMQARRNINSKATHRGPIKELLILNY
ncbi:MAG: DNA adenine methylase [Anaerolineae bacterium]|nr:DNA adenine methylase [Anaerolineae bacterium]